MLLTYTCTSGQTTEDYLVTNTLDTLYGKIKPLDYGQSPKVQLQTSESKTLYSIFETKAYSYNGDIYLPVRNYDRYEFMKLILSGYLSLYAFIPPNQNGYDGLFLQKMDGTFMEVPNLGFKKQMSRYLYDCGTVGERIASGELSRKNLEEIILEYNACIDIRTNEKLSAISVKAENKEKVDPWKVLEEKIKSTAEFEGKTTALEMVTEIVKKVSKGEKVPSFIVDGLKNVLNNQEHLKEPLATALKMIEN
jgi:hypothetical protein